MKTMGGRIKSRLAEVNMTQSELARKVGVKQQTINYLIKQDGGDGASTSRYGTAIAEALGVNPKWLYSGIGEPTDPTVTVNVGGHLVRTTHVPLLARDSILELVASGKVTSIGLVMTDKAHPERGFATDVETPQMIPRYVPGDRVIVDMDMEPQPGDYVAVVANGKPCLRRYRALPGGQFELVAENQDWPVIQSSEVQKIVGVIVEHRSYRREVVG